MAIRIIKWLDEHFEEYILMILISLIAIIINVEVFKRYIMGVSSAYVDEIARYLFIGITFIGVSYGVKLKKQIVIDVLPEKMPKIIDFALEILSNLIAMIFSLVFIYFSIITLKFVEEQGMLTEALMIPKWSIMSVMTLGFSLTIIRLIQDCFTITENYRNDKKRNRIYSE